MTKENHVIKQRELCKHHKIFKAPTTPSEEPTSKLRI